jgi:hypothetical protein
MGCTLEKLPEGGFAILCGRGQRKPAPCKFCGRPQTKLCDFPVTRHRSSTCDAPCCNNHAKSVGLNLDYCLTHWHHAEQLKLEPKETP